MQALVVPFASLCMAAALACLPTQGVVAQSARSGERPGQIPVLPPDLSYPEARTRMMNAGFQPMGFSVTWQQAQERCGSRPEICLTYPEAEACASTGMSPCRMVFLGPGGGAVAIITGGEEMARLSVATVFPIRGQEAADLHAMARGSRSLYMPGPPSR